MEEKKTKTIFVTVGTTLFDALIQAATAPRAMEWMSSAGYTDLIIQHGKGPAPRITIKTSTEQEQPPHLRVECYDFKASLHEDMERADLVLSHAGAGTVMEALMKHRKKLVVVINTLLMHNHQVELADAMQARGHLHVVHDPADLLFDDQGDQDDDGDESENNNKTTTALETWNAMEEFTPVPATAGDEYQFSNLLDSFMGFLGPSDDDEDDGRLSDDEKKKKK